MGLTSERLRSVLTRSTIAEGELPAIRVCISFRTIHQLGPCGRYDKVARHLHAYRILERCLSIESIEEEHRPLIAKLPRAVPIGPAVAGVVQVQIADALELLGARRNRIFEHQLPCFLTEQPQLHD